MKLYNPGGDGPYALEDFGLENRPYSEAELDDLKLAELYGGVEEVCTDGKLEITLDRLCQGEDQGKLVVNSVSCGGRLLWSRDEPYGLPEDL